MRWTLVGLLATLALCGWMLVDGLPRINAWERANGYPYGKLCEFYHNCKGD